MVAQVAAYWVVDLAKEWKLGWRSDEVCMGCGVEKQGVSCACAVPDIGELQPQGQRLTRVHGRFLQGVAAASFLVSPDCRSDHAVALVQLIESLQLDQTFGEV